MEVGNLKIALCITGQPRTWERCYQTWYDNISHLGRIDTFCHLWDYNTLPSIAAGYQGDMKNRPVPLDELERMKKVLRPKMFMTEPEMKFRRPPTRHPIAWWSLGQFYSIKKCAYLKRKYELLMGFEYDLVFRIRTDLFIRQKIEIPELKPNELYTCSNSYDRDYDRFRIGDIFYYGDSYTYDQACSYYDKFSFIDAHEIVPGRSDFPPELGFYYHLRSLGIDNRSIFADCKIARTDEFRDLKGSLAAFEI